MKHLICILLIVFTLPAKAFVLAEGYFGITFPTVEFKENTGSDLLGYSSGFNYGFDLGARVGVNFMGFQAGVTGLWGRSSVNITIKDEDGSIFNTKSANNMSENVGTGAFIGYEFEKVRVFAEYYNSYKSEFYSVDSKSENPFEKDDYMQAQGLGYGLSYNNGTFFIYSLMYRTFWVEEMRLRGVTYTDSDERYKAGYWDVFTAQLTVRF
jgi:hypothetical protein